VGSGASLIGACSLFMTGCLPAILAREERSEKGKAVSMRSHRDGSDASPRLQCFGLTSIHSTMNPCKNLPLGETTKVTR